MQQRYHFEMPRWSYDPETVVRSIGTAMMLYSHLTRIRRLMIIELIFHVPMAAVVAERSVSWRWGTFFFLFGKAAVQMRGGITRNSRASAWYGAVIG